MSFIDNIFSNQMIKDVAFGKLKKTMKEENLKAILVELDEETDEFKFTLVKQELIVIPKDEFDALKESYIKNLENGF